MSSNSTKDHLSDEFFRIIIDQSVRIEQIYTAIDNYTAQITTYNMQTLHSINSTTSNTHPHTHVTIHPADPPQIKSDITPSSQKNWNWRDDPPSYDETLKAIKSGAMIDAQQKYEKKRKS